MHPRVDTHNALNTPPWLASTSSFVDVNQESDSSSSSSQCVPWIDRTSLDIPFDHSCFDALDEQLLYHPTQSFADVCWAEAVHEPRRRSFQQVLPRINTDSEFALAADTDAEAPAPAYLPFADKLNTPGPHRLAAEPYLPPTFHAPYLPTPYPPHGQSLLNVNVNLKTTVPRVPAPVSDPAPFALLPPRFTQSDPSESIGFFPTRPQDHARRPSKIPARFFAYLHARTLPRV
ncbi:hypothetical protein C8R47DRAFT_494711 [Mycena vitilis]|nr:hypothetical protein C8R47DRAFT_494711 [Mycena vitilis]